jgi:hypothetical protein
MSQTKGIGLTGELVEMAQCDDDKDKVEIKVIVDKSEFAKLYVNLLYKRVDIKMSNEQDNLK